MWTEGGWEGRREMCDVEGESCLVSKGKPLYVLGLTLIIISNAVTTITIQQRRPLLPVNKPVSEIQVSCSLRKATLTVLLFKKKTLL